MKTPKSSRLEYMSLSKFKISLLAFFIFLSCSVSDKASKEYLVTLEELGWTNDNMDSLFVLFTSVNQCFPCNKEIQEWNSKYGNSKQVLLVVNEKYTSNYENYLSANSIDMNSIQDKKGLFRRKELIPFLPYKIMIHENGVKDLGELGK